MSIFEVETITNIIQNITIVMATCFTAWWTYATFGHKEKTDELMVIAKKISEIHSHLDRCVSHYRWHEVFQRSFVTISPEEVEKENIRYSNQKKEQEIRLDILLNEFEELRSLSFRIPIAFRLLDMVAYDEHVRANSDIKKLAEDKDAVRNNMKVKYEILHNIERQINANKSLFNQVRVTYANIIFHTKAFSKTSIF